MAVQADELGAFLRSRRERRAPAEVSLPNAGRRRTSGLRREEVAVLAGIGTSWLARIEQGRATTVSDAVLDRLAEVLGLTEPERHHLFSLAHDRSAPAPVDPAEPPSPELRAMLDALNPSPAYLLDECWDVVAWNDAEAALFPQLPATTEPNLLRMMFGHPDLRAIQRDWHAELDRLTREFRHHLTDHPSPRADALVADLLADHPEFAERWARHDVASFQAKPRDFDHPLAGPLRFLHHRFALLDRPGWHLVLYVSDAGTGTADRLATLLVP